VDADHDRNTFSTSWDDCSGTAASKPKFDKPSFGRIRPTNVIEQVPAGANKRKEGRRRTLFTGMLASCSGGCTIDCTVTNFSMSGARVRVDTGALIFGKVILVHLREKLAFETRIVWRNGRDLGLEFTRAHDLNRATKAEMQVLRRYCVDHEPAVIALADDRRLRNTTKSTFGSCRKPVSTAT
jgi:PilZ domain-containing protein